MSEINTITTTTGTYSISDKVSRKILNKVLGPKEFSRVMKEIEKEEALERKKIRVTGPDVKYIDFKPPLTIACFSDGTKTIVKMMEGDIFDPEKGAAMAIAKKYLGDRYKSTSIIQHYVDKYNEKHPGEAE